MSTQIKYSFTRNDDNYKNAVNYDGRNYFHSPLTIEINGVLFITGFGNTDSKLVKIDGNLVYIVAENTGLNYISMLLIDLTDNSVNECYINSNDLNDKKHSCYGIFDKELDEQIKLLSEYLPY